MTVHVTSHAISRYRERVAPVSADQAATAMRECKAASVAAAIGAPYVRLPTGQRLVLKGCAIVTVLPAEANPVFLIMANREED